MERIWKGPEDTFRDGVRLGKAMAAAKDPIQVVRLYGELGTGKTLFCSGVVEGLGGRAQDVTSPTYVYMQEYPAGLPVRHLDLYRVESGEAFWSLGLAEAFEEPGVTLVEWPEVADPLLEARGIRMVLTREGEGRRMKAEALDPQGASLLMDWEAME